MTKRFQRWTVGIVGSIVLPAALVSTGGAASAATAPTTAARASAAVQTSTAAQTSTAEQMGIVQRPVRHHWVRIGTFRTYQACERYNLRHNRHYYRHFCRYERVHRGRHHVWVLYWYEPVRR